MMRNFLRIMGFVMAVRGLVAADTYSLTDWQWYGFTVLFAIGLVMYEAVKA